MKKLSLFSFASMSFVLIGCSLTPNYMRPSLDSMPSHWKYQEEVDAQAEINKSVVKPDWWTNFKSAELNALVAEALSNNNDLRAGIQRIEQSRAALKIANASLFPSLNSSAGASRSLSNPVNESHSYNSALQGGLSASYEVDLFGENDASISAADANLQSTIFTQDALALSVMGDVASGYFSVLNLKERIAIADQNIKNANEVLRIINARVNVGTVSDLDLAQQTSALANAKANRESLKQQLGQAENALAVLLGKAPQDILIQGRKLTGLKIPSIAPSQPASLLERRPDLRATEASLIAANANIGVARAAFYPSLSISLSPSIATTGFGDPTSTAISLATSLTAPLFQGGRLEGGLEQATSRQKELVETYRKSILVAFQDVENALLAVDTAERREQLLRTTMQQAQKAYTLSKQQYDAGAIDYQTLLDTQNAKLSAEDSYTQSRLARLNASIDLYMALGGGWE